MTRRGGLVGQDHGLRGAHAGCRERLVAGEHAGEDDALAVARDQEGGERLGVHVREREREARVRRRPPRLGNVDDRARVGELLVVPGIEGAGVAVRPDP
jgi:hypothetical protein